MASIRPTFASKTTFDSLAVDSGEETEDEEILEPHPRLVRPYVSAVSLMTFCNSTLPEPELKPTKSALKKAARAARKQLQQAKSKRSASPSSETPSISPPDSVFHPVEIPREAETSLPKPAQSPDANGGPSSVMAPETTTEPVLLPEIPPPLPPPPEPATCALQTPVELPPPLAKDPVLREYARPDVEKNSLQSENPALITEETKKRQNVLTRTLWTFIMIGTFLGALLSPIATFHANDCAVLLLLGHAYMILLVMLCQTLVYREVTALFSLTSSDEESKTGKDPWSTTLNWYFFVVTNYFLYGESIIYYFKVCGAFESHNLLTRAIARRFRGRTVAPFRHQP
jgi:phosphatidate cytidylyltransferase